MVSVPKKSFSSHLSLLAELVTSDVMNIDPELLDNDLSSAIGTETLIVNDLVPDGLPDFSKGRAQEALHCIGGVKY